MKRTVSFALLGIAAGIVFLMGPARAARGGKQPPNQNFLTRSDFGDADRDGVRSDGQSILVPPECGSYDYVDNQDTCSGDVRTTSYLQTDGGYFLTTHTQDATVDRWLVLDFGAGDACPVSDVDLNSDPECQVTVRFFADKAFHSQATSTPVRILIEKFDPSLGYWATKYELDFINTLSISPADPNTVEIGAGPNDFRADLWTVVRGKKRTLLGTFTMPFFLTLTKTNQVFVPGA